MTSRLFLIGMLLIGGCSSTDTAIQSSPTPGPSDYNVFIVFGPPDDGSFTAQMDNRTYDSGGASIARLSAGTHQMTGSFRGSSLSISFATVDTAGGVRTGTVASLAGPLPQVSSCGVTYSNTATPTVQRDFQLQFAVNDNGQRVCSSPPP
jgi:hypothetical protein